MYLIRERWAFEVECEFRLEATDAGITSLSLAGPIKRLLNLRLLTSILLVVVDLPDAQFAVWGLFGVCDEGLHE